jgi:hypothetical protein
MVYQIADLEVVSPQTSAEAFIYEGRDRSKTSFLSQSMENVEIFSRGH